MTDRSEERRLPTFKRNLQIFPLRSVGYPVKIAVPGGIKTGGGGSEGGGHVPMPALIRVSVVFPIHGDDFDVSY